MVVFDFLAQGWGLARGMQNPFSFLALAARSPPPVSVWLGSGGARAGESWPWREAAAGSRAKGETSAPSLPLKSVAYMNPPLPPAQFFCFFTPQSTPVEEPAAAASSVAGACQSSPGLISVPPVRICIEAVPLPPLLGSGEVVCFRLLLLRRVDSVVLCRLDLLLLPRLSSIRAASSPSC